MRALAVCCVRAFLQTSSPVSEQESSRQADIPSFEGKVRPVLVAHCYGCHSHEVKKPKGTFRLDRLSVDLAEEASRERWREVLEPVKVGEMPPKSKPRRTEQEIRLLSDWISGRAEAAEASRRGHGRVVLRRLNCFEYENTMRDLLGWRSI